METQEEPCGDSRLGCPAKRSERSRKKRRKLTAIKRAAIVWPIQFDYRRFALFLRALRRIFAIHSCEYIVPRHFGEPQWQGAGSSSSYRL